MKLNHRTTLACPHIILAAASLFFSVTLGACSSDSGDSGAGSLESCDTTNDCSGNEVCVGVGDSGACHINCTAEVNSCGGSASCEGIGGISASICKTEEPDAGDGDSEEAEPEEEWLRCSSDEECKEFDPASVCGSQWGESYCTYECAEDSNCNPPPALGVETRFGFCGEDEGLQERGICLPRRECFENPDMCITTNTGEPDSGSGGSFPGIDDPDEGFPQE